jgi:hypothetical protein
MQLEVEIHFLNNLRITVPISSLSPDATSGSMNDEAAFIFGEIIPLIFASRNCIDS